MKLKVGSMLQQTNWRTVVKEPWQTNNELLLPW